MDQLFSPSLSLVVDQKGKKSTSGALINKSSLSKWCETASVFTHSLLVFMFVCAFVLKTQIWEWLVKARCVITPSHTKWPKTWVKSHISSALSPARWIMSYMFSAPQPWEAELSTSLPAFQTHSQNTYLVKVLSEQWEISVWILWD